MLKEKDMEKFYLTINSRDFTFDADVVRDMFGVAGEIVVDTYDENRTKFAFFNTGNLCQVEYIKRSKNITVSCFAANDCVRESVLGWLKKYMRNSLDWSNFGVDFNYTDKNKFIANVYELAPGIHPNK